MNRHYSITHFLCDSTYGFQFTYIPYEELNEMVRQRAPLTLEKHYGTERPYISEIPEFSKEPLKKYMFIAWLDGISPNGDEDTDGDHLFVIGLTDFPETCVGDIYRMGDEYFDKLAKGYYY